ncbi:hypothetical protein JFL43_09925 [Viridibacillus sp. YIM B01967]|uniref:Uncharacterized protein n=1 Tax=Viridibacillus soli TaxID=2798301 RepID=A0ABS1H6Y3_9BACL|nr:hypothetical protein [Viridibacillus soli]MBK3495167.1 hypothetical protein [Viridibacillus soli]
MSKIVPYLLNPFCITVVVVLTIFFGNQALVKYATKSYPLATLYLTVTIACIAFITYLIKEFRLKAKAENIEKD